MRIGIGIILLLDLFIRSLSIKAFFTNEGVLPLDTLKQYNFGSRLFFISCYEWRIMVANNAIYN